MASQFFGKMAPTKPFRILVFSKTAGYRHDSIPAGITSTRDFSERTKLFDVDASEDAGVFTPASLGQYAVIILLQCIGPFLSSDQIEALKGFVRAGGGIVGIHGAAAGMPEDEWYGRLIGAHFDSHPQPELGNVTVDDGQHWISMESRIDWMDEWYNFRTHPRSNPNLKILLKGDTTSFNGGKMGEDHPLAWCQEFEGGRSFFTALGHFQEAYRDKWFLEHMFKAIFWVARREDDAWTEEFQRGLDR